MHNRLGMKYFLSTKRYTCASKCIYNFKLFVFIRENTCTSTKKKEEYVCLWHNPNFYQTNIYQITAKCRHMIILPQDIFIYTNPMTNRMVFENVTINIIFMGKLFNRICIYLG